MQQRNENKKKMHIYEKISKCFVRPAELFEFLKKNESMTDAFLYNTMLSLIFLILSAVIFVRNSSDFVFMIYSYLGTLTGFVFAFVFVVAFILLIALNFLSAVVYHIFVKLLGGKKSFSSTFKAVSYAATPSLILGWIPFLGYLITFHYLYLTARGISIMQEMSPKRAALATLTPIIIIIVLSIVFALGLFLKALDAGLVIRN